MGSFLKTDVYWRLVRVEIWRLLARRRSLLWLLAALVVSVFVLRPGSEGGWLQVAGALSTSGRWLLFFTPLAVGLCAASSLAEDRARGYCSLLLLRGVSRPAYVSAKALAMAGAGGICVLACIVCFYAVALCLLPLGRVDPTLIDNTPGPIPALFMADPLLNDVVLGGMMTMAGAALPQVGLLSGVLIRSEYFAVGAPFAAVLVLAILFHGDLTVLAPGTYLDLWNGYADELPSAVLPYAAFVYWLLLGGLLTAISQFLFARWEEA